MNIAPVTALNLHAMNAGGVTYVGCFYFQINYWNKNVFSLKGSFFSIRKAITFLRFSYNIFLRRYLHPLYISALGFITY